MSKSFRGFYSMMEEQFIDLYDFLGIPPVSPPNLIYLAILKIESFDFSQEGLFQKKDCIEGILSHLAIAKEQLLNTSARRQAYEQAWESYYFPNNGNQTDIEKLRERNAQSRFLKGRLRTKSFSHLQTEEIDDFDYSQDFSYFVMRDLPTERDVFFLNPERQIQLSPLEDTIFFQDKQFFLDSQGKIQVEVTNDALGKIVIVKEKAAKLPLHIGDRIEFVNGTRLILRSVYSNREENKSSEHGIETLAIYLTRENVTIELLPTKIYILGRNTSDIHHLSFEENKFCFVNIGRRERSISRQNFQIFFHNGQWYIQDLGSRYGTTLDLQNHFRFETLAGGSIMRLEKGLIRLGYDKSYTIEVDTLANLRPRYIESDTLANNAQSLLNPSFYDIPLL